MTEPHKVPAGTEVTSNHQHINESDFTFTNVRTCPARNLVTCLNDTHRHTAGEEARLRGHGDRPVLGEAALLCGGLPPGATMAGRGHAMEQRPVCGTPCSNPLTLLPSFPPGNFFFSIERTDFKEIH